MGGEWSCSSASIKILPSLRKYVDVVVTEKKEPGCNSFVTLKDILKDKLFPAKLSFFISTCALFEPFLKEFQTDAPMAPFVYNEITSIVLSLAEKVVKKEHLETVSGRVGKLDLSSSNLLPTKHVDLGFATKDALRSCETTSDLEKLNFKRDVKEAVLVMIKKIVEKSPVKYPLSKAITCLDPGVIKMKAGDNHMTACLELLVARKWLSGIKADAIKRQYITLFSTEHVINQCKVYRRNQKRLDDFLIELISAEGTNEFKELRHFIEIILTLSHGNSTVERGFSVNKQCIVENLKEESLVALRKICDGVSAAGGVDGVEITTELMHLAKNAHSRYSEYLAKQREERKEKVQAERERKEAAKEKKKLEEEKSLLLSDARKRAAELESKIAELGKKCKQN